ncbi:NAD-dependent epimerase/dehydratase family protein [Thermogladius sp. KZ2Tp1]|uniref:NAD-dependent epimerase/dehydratase family protein n=1 Tax=unclassified Thermogladius TaxID=2647734 RepID=UPI003D101BCE
MIVLVTGSTGQIGSELVPALRELYGKDRVIASGRNVAKLREIGEPYVELDVLRRDEIARVVKEYKVNVIVHLAAVLSARGEQDPALAWDVNTNGTLNVFEVARESRLDMVVVPSSIAVYGPETPDNPGDITVMRPKTIYGISKVITELLGEYYYLKYGLDVRGPRLPGVISWKTPPGGGTTDYAVEAFYEAVKRGEYTFWVRPDTRLPMIYMPDAVRAFTMLMKADSTALTVRFYNVQGMSFTAKELADTIAKYIPGFKADFKPDPLRQRIADSWPKSIDDSRARRDWGWRPMWDLESMARDMIENLKKSLGGKG